MTVLASLGSTQYTPQAQNIPFSVAVGATRIDGTLTHANTLAAWPSGALLEYEVFWDGISTGKSRIGGGVQNNKAGVPLTGNVVTGFGTTKKPGAIAGSVRVTVLQTLTSAILIEAF